MCGIMWTFNLCSKCFFEVFKHHRPKYTYVLTVKHVLKDPEKISAVLQRQKQNLVMNVKDEEVLKQDMPY